MVKSLLVAFLIGVAGAGIYNFDDAVRDMAPGGTGADVALELIHFVNDAKLGSDPETDKFFDFIGDLMYHFQIKTLYESPYLRELPGGYRGVVFSGSQGKDEYNLRLTGSDYNEMTAMRLGNVVAEFGLKRDREIPDKGTGFLGEMRIKTAFQHLSHKNVLALPEGFLKVIDPENMYRMQSLRTRSVRHIENEALQVIHEFYKAFPQSTGVTKQYIFIYHSLLKRFSYKDRQYTRSHFRALFMMDRIRADYPAIAEYLESLRGFFKFTVTLRNPQGHILTTFTADCQDNFFENLVYTDDAMVIPFDDQGNPVFDEAIKLTDLTDYEFDINVDSWIDVFGLKFETKGVKAKGAFHATDDRGEASFKLVHYPMVEVSGRLGSVVPKWVVDLAIPNNMAYYIDAFFTTMIEADNGKGSELKLTWNSENPEDVRFYINGESEFLDNFYLRFAMAAVVNQFKVSGEAKEEAIGIWNNFTAGLVHDLEMYRTKAACVPSGRPH